MSKKHHGPEHEKEWKRRERIQREVLMHLKERGPTHSDVLYVAFDPQDRFNTTSVG